MLYFWARLAQVSPLTTKWNCTQLEIMPGWAGDGVEMPPAGRVVVVVVVDGVVWRVVRVGVVLGGARPMMDTQTFTESQRPRQSAPTDGFQDTNCAVLMLCFAAMVAQFSSLTTKWKALQLATMSGWMGRGVETPLDGVVVAGGGAAVVVVASVGSGGGVGSLKASTQ